MTSIHDIADMTFKLAPGRDLDNFKSNLQVFNILLAMDGNRSVRMIAKDNFYEVAELAEKVKQLAAQGILAPVQGGVKTGAAGVDQALFTFLQTELTKLLGPIAGMLIKETIKKMGHTPDDLPAGKYVELMNALASYIQNDSKAMAFKKAMLSKFGLG